MAAPLTPEVFGDFLLVQRLARSAMAEVLVAVRLGDRSGRTYVVKRPVLGERASGRAAQAIAREAEVLEAVRGPGLPALQAAGEIAGLPYLAMEHVRGAPLDELLARSGPLPEGAAVAVARDLARALAALHAAGWVHGDVTPSNVIVDDAGEAKLIDLGLAQRAGERRAEVAGKPGYVAPEAVLPGPARPAEDVYGLGVVIAECALGRRLYSERDLVEAATRGDAPKEVAALGGALPGLPAALARRPEARPTIDALLRGLEAAPVDRGALAELVERAAGAASAAAAVSASAAVSAAASAAVSAAAPVPVSAPAPALTPTAPLVMPATTLAMTRPAKTAPPSHAKTTIAMAASGSTAPPPAAARASAAPPHPAAASAAPSRWITLALAAALIFLLGGITGRVTGRAAARSQPGALSLGFTLPRRAQLELDGQRVSYPVNGALPVRPGPHTLAIVLPKGVRREYTFHVGPNEHIVLTPPSRRNGGAEAPEPAPEEDAP